MQRLDEIKKLAQSGDFAQAQELYRNFMKEMFIWDEKDQLFRRKDAPQQITLSKDQYDDFINHHFKEWCGSQKRSMMKEMANQSSIVVLNEGKSIDVKSDAKSRSKSQSKSHKDEDDEHFLSDNELEDVEHESIIAPVRKSASRRKELSRARDDLPTLKSSQSKPTSSHKVQDASSQKVVESVSVKKSESTIASLASSASKQSAAKQSAKRPSPIKTNDSTERSAIRSSAVSAVKQSASKQLGQSAIKHTEESIKQTEETPLPRQSQQKATVESSSKKTDTVASNRREPDQSAQKAQKIILPESQPTEEPVKKAQSAQKSAIRQSVEVESTTPVTGESLSATKQTHPSEIAETNNFEPASYVKKVYNEEVKSVPASSQKINKSQCPDKGVLIAYQSLIYPPFEVTRPEFETYKQNNSELLFSDPITGYPFVILRNKKAGSICRVFATGDALTMQQNSFGLKNLYESRYLMRNFIRDISTIRTLSSTLSVSAQKLN